MRFSFHFPDSVLNLPLILNGFCSRVLETRYGHIHYFVKQAPQQKGVLVFLHGIGASSGHYAHVLIHLQKAGYTVFALDWPSHGMSPDPHEKLSPELLQKILVEWTDKVVPGKFVLLGNSLGGGMALQYTLQKSSRLEGLILISPVGGFASPEVWKTFKETLVIESIQDSKRWIQKIYHREPIYMPLIYLPFLETMNRKGIRELIESSSYEDMQFKDEIPQGFPPTLFIWGKSEKLFPRENLNWFKKNLPSSVIFEEPENVGHCPQLDCKEWLRSRILEFVEA